MALREYDVAVVLIGTNDLLYEIEEKVNASFLLNNYKKNNKPDKDRLHVVETYQNDYVEIVTQLNKKESIKKILCVSLPPIAEGIDIPETDGMPRFYALKRLEYQEAIKKAVSTSPKAVYVPFGERLEESLREIKAKGGVYSLAHLDFERMNEIQYFLGPMIGSKFKNSSGICT